MRVRGKALFLTAALVAAWPSPALAQHMVTATPTVHRRDVDVQIAADAKARGGIETAMRDRVSGLGLSPSFVTVERVASRDVLGSETSEARLARIWVDAADHDSVTLYVVGDANERVLVRKLPRNANPEVTWEEVGTIVELTLEALKEGQLIGMSRDAAREELLPKDPEPAAAPTPAPVAKDEPPLPLSALPSDRPRWEADGAGYYSASVLGDGLGVGHALGVAAELVRYRQSLGLGGLLTAEYHFPAASETALATVKTEGGAVHLLGAVASRSRRGHVLELALGAGVDVRDIAPSADATSTLRLEGRTDVVPEARALVRYRHRTKVLGVFAGLGLDVALSDKRYVLQRGAGETVLLDPWRARPFLMVGIETP